MSASRPVVLDFPGHRAPRAGLESPFEMLTACHERVERMLALLTRLRVHLATQGWDASAASAATDVLGYFDRAAPQHHLDEEMHVFPAVLALDHGRMDRLIDRLKQEHLEMEKLWAGVRQTLELVAHGEAKSWTPWTPADHAGVDLFLAVYQDHIADEESHIYPAAEQAISGEKLLAMSRDMRRRRGQSSASAE